MNNKPKFTGMWGIWNERTKKFLFGIQEPTKLKADIALNNRIGTKNSYRKPHFVPKRIQEKHAPMFYKGLKCKNRQNGGQS